MNRNNLLDPLKFLTNIGQAGASNQAANVGSFGSANAANITGAANATAAGQVGAANAITSGIGNTLGQYQMNTMMNRFMNGQSTSAYNSPKNGGNFMTSDPNSYGDGYGPSGFIS
jgi:hypothetical protein